MRRKGGPEGGVALLQAAKAAERDAAAHRPSAAQKQQQIAELEERAVIFGDPVKQSAQAKVLERKWLRFLLVHGEAFKFDARVGPTVELVKHFVAYAFCTRDTVSAIGREGLGDSFELQIRYMLAKFVFVALTYNGWTGLDAHELHVKAEPLYYTYQVRGVPRWCDRFGQYNIRLGRNSVRVARCSGEPLVGKPKFRTPLYSESRLCPRGGYRG